MRFSNQQNSKQIALSVMFIIVLFLFLFS